ncbi:endonuclease/exonuclease/phosphatase family protein [Tropicibacter naphthalenivorans]|uniref:endonuclease/exonuclease/phosphatase family protein n=1 Tax=Tropicibacter naphthalenivorans TaxID=441103 RepID=UPI001FD258C2|nr:endonuclease/exonuclease/phosphatase family protein [Tropicibacter naphthalenivorans]
MADTVRVATWDGKFSRKHPGILVKELASGDPVPGVDVIAEASPDVLLLTDLDYDAGLVALRLLADQAGGYPHLFAQRPNTGRPTGLDLDGDGRLGGPGDAQGFGWFSGQSGMAVLSRYPVELISDNSAILWRDVPSTAMVPEDTGHDIQRLASSGFWALRIDAPTPFTLLTLAATPPVFDGPEDRNGRRGRDEVLFWPNRLSNPATAPPAPWVIAGKFNIDPMRGDGRHEAARAVLADPRWTDPLPGQPTAAWDDLGELRLSYVLPDRALPVLDAGVTPPAPDAGPHRLVWVDLDLAPTQAQPPRPPPRPGPSR